MLAMRRFLTVLAVVGTATALTAGCHSSSRGGPLPEAATLVKEASVTTQKLASAHLLLSVTGKIEKLPVKTVEGDLTNVPQTAAKGTADILIGGSDINAKFVVFDGTLYGALSGDDYMDMGPASDTYDIAAILSPDRGLANMLANFTNPKAAGRESIGGKQVARITGEVTADAVNKLAPQLKADAPMPATVWIEEDGDHELVQAQLEPSPGNAVSMTLSNWNAPVSVEKPAGV